MVVCEAPVVDPAVYSISFVVLPRASVTVVVGVPPDGGVTVVRSPP